MEVETRTMTGSPKPVDTEADAIPFSVPVSPRRPPCACLSSCCPADGVRIMDDGYNCREYCCGIIHYLNDNIWVPFVGFLWDLLAGCNIYPTDYAERRPVLAFLDKYPNGTEFKEQARFYRDFIKLPPAAQERALAAISEENPDDGTRTVEQRVLMGLHNRNGALMEALQGFVRDAM